VIDFFGLPFIAYSRFVEFVSTLNLDLSNDAMFVGWIVYHLVKYYFIVQIFMFIRYVVSFFWRLLKKQA